MACCGYGGPPLNYDSRIACGQTKVLDGNNVTAKACNDSSEYINWDGIHYTETANQFVASQILTGKYSDPPFADKMPFLLKLKFWGTNMLVIVLFSVYLIYYNLLKKFNTFMDSWKYRTYGSCHDKYH